MMSNYIRVFAQGHAYFITIVTYHREPLLCQHIDLFRSALLHSKQFFDYTIDAIAVLPDHIHLIILPKNVHEYPKIIQSIKHYFSRHFPYTMMRTPVQTKRREAGIWQRRYYEHTIRNEYELQKYRDYIHYNPVKHGLCTSALDWKYSSFRKFVDIGVYAQDWYSLGDEIEIE